MSSPSRLRWPAAGLLFALLVALSLYAETAKHDGVWAGHVGAGKALLSGSLPANPTYPMWGYSLLAGAFGDALVYVQAALCAAILLWWHRSLSRIAGPAARNDWLMHPAVAVLLLAPWILLATSYYSNSAAALLAFAGTWLLVEAVEGERRTLPARLLAGALCLGLAANVRTEMLLLAALLCGALAAGGLRGEGPRAALFRAVAVAAVVVACMVPWWVYASWSSGRPVLTPTNGGAVAYLGLGVVPDNVWGIEPVDSFAHEIARRELGTDAWSAEANAYFRAAFADAVREHPGAFARRVLRGWQLLLMQGVTALEVERVLRPSERDAILADYANERLKARLGLKVNPEDVRRYRSLGLEPEDAGLRHWAMVLAEYGLRLVLATVFLGLLAYSARAAARLGTREILTRVWIAHVATIFALAGLVQTLPRHTTLMLPILVSVAVVARARR